MAVDGQSPLPSAPTESLSHSLSAALALARASAFGPQAAIAVLYASGCRPGGTGLVTAKDGQSPS